MKLRVILFINFLDIGPEKISHYANLKPLKSTKVIKLFLKYISFCSATNIIFKTFKATGLKSINLQLQNITSFVYKRFITVNPFSSWAATALTVFVYWVWTIAKTGIFRTQYSFSTILDMVDETWKLVSFFQYTCIIFVWAIDNSRNNKN